MKTTKLFTVDKSVTPWHLTCDNCRAGFSVLVVDQAAIKFESERHAAEVHRGAGAKVRTVAK